jgi:hypothetical protein
MKAGPVARISGEQFGDKRVYLLDGLARGLAYHTFSSPRKLGWVAPTPFYGCRAHP